MQRASIPVIYGALFLMRAVFQTGGPLAGSCTAALFLKAFVEGIEPKADEDKAPLRWAHIDIAHTSDVRDARDLGFT